MTQYLVLSVVIWITYLYTLKTSFVIDDQDSYAGYDGKLQRLAYGDIAKWLRYHLAGGNFPSRFSYVNQSGQSLAPIPQGRVPTGHHFLSVAVFNLAILAMFYPLSLLLGKDIAFMALLMLSVHPISSQIVAWVSGIGYPLSLLWMGLSLNLVFIAKPDSFISSILVFLAFAGLQYLMINALLATSTFFLLLAFLGYYDYAFISLLVAGFLGIRTIKATHKARETTFKEQNMGDSAKFTIRKIVTAFQTISYYIPLSLFPLRIGLYHTWGYHYDKEQERFNRRFWIGLFYCALIAVGIILCSFPIKLGLLVYVLMLFTFMNWITIQQFITERYVFLPTLGLCILLASFLHGNPILYFIIGAYWIRTILHLPTYRDEVTFYQSNIWNFPESEIAYGNLGCTYLRMGRSALAIECWLDALKINPEYDVANYNIFSHYKANALMRLSSGDLNATVDLLKMAEPYLKNCLASKLCHFRDGWQKEYNEVLEWIKNPYSLLPLEKSRLAESKKQLLSRPLSLEVQTSLNDIEVRLKRIQEVEEKIKCQFSSQDDQASSASTSQSSTPTQTVST